MRVLFLDIDGVLNDNTGRPTREAEIHSRLKGPARWAYELDQERCGVLQREVVDKVPGLAIVISSSWRVLRSHAFPYVLQANGVHAPVIGFTGHKESNDVSRGEIIKRWLDGWEGQDLEGYAIIDDDRILHGRVFEGSDAIRKRFVLTRGGIRKRKAERLVQRLMLPM